MQNVKEMMPPNQMGVGGITIPVLHSSPTVGCTFSPLHCSLGKQEIVNDQPLLTLLSCIFFFIIIFCTNNFFFSPDHGLFLRGN